MVIILKYTQFSRSVMSDSLQPYGLQHARLPCLSLTPRAYSNSCPLSQWSHPTISPSVVPFSSCLQSFPALGSYPMSQLFAPGGWSIAPKICFDQVWQDIQTWKRLSHRKKLPGGAGQQTGLHRAAPGLTRRLKEQGASMGVKLQGSFHGR